MCQLWDHFNIGASGKNKREKKRERKGDGEGDLRMMYIFKGDGNTNGDCSGDINPFLPFQFHLFAPLLPV